MRFLDIAVAGLIGMSGIASLVAWDPHSNSLDSKRSADEAHLRDILTTYLETKGLPWLQRATLQELCASLMDVSNATFSLSGTVDSAPCGLRPPDGAASARLTVELDSKVVVLQAWYNAEG